MKSILILLQLCTIFNLVNAQTTELEDFRSSRSEQLVESNRLFTGLHIDYTSSTVKYVQADSRTTFPVLLLRVYDSQNTLVGLLKAIKDVGTSQLPDGHDYAMVYNDFTRFNQTTSTGTIVVYDVNYANFVASSFVFSNGDLTSWEANGIPNDIATTYNVNRAHYCDSNHNGNVTWGECYKCMKDACTSSPNCMGLCEVADLFGGQCSGSIAAACVYLSIAY